MPLGKLNPALVGWRCWSRVEALESGGGQDRRVEDAQISISSDWDGHLLLLLRALGTH